MGWRGGWTGCDYADCSEGEGEIQYMCVQILGNYILSSQ